MASSLLLWGGIALKGNEWPPLSSYGGRGESLALPSLTGSGWENDNTPHDHIHAVINIGFYKHMR